MKSMSLRGRLLTATVALVALGLLVADAATLGLLRSQLIGRVDDQLRGARFDAARALNTSNGFGPFGDGPGRNGAQGFYAELVDESGSIQRTNYLGFGVPPSPPRLPPVLPGATSYRGSSPVVLFTSGATGRGPRYRVLANAVDPAGTLIVALPLTETEATLRKLLLVEGGVSALVLAAVAALALWLVRLGMRPLTQMEHAAADIAAGDLSRRVEPADARTEVGRLGLALNVMLERIEAAFAERRASEARLRRFVGDASHELRTPLTSIRGYAELFRHGAKERPKDLAKTMRRIEEESTRMGDLVDELLLLARLDQGRPLDREPVDLAIVARDAVEDARAVQPERPIEAVIEAEAIVQGDDARLRQVAANLIANALEHTPSDAAVRVRVAIEGDNAILEVADEGPGLSADDAAKVFDRFFRVDPARARENGGAGLGLSIVDAIVQAHGGRVRVASEPGRGARFVATIPLTGAPAPESVEPPAPASESAQPPAPAPESAQPASETHAG